MAITNYTELQTAVGNWLNRSDLTARIPEFIALAEPGFRRKLRDKKAVSSGAMSTGTDSILLSAVNSAIKEVESIRYNTTSMKHALTQVHPADLASLRSVGTGIPRYFAIVDGAVYWDVEPSSAYTIQVSYIEKITPLSGSNTTNSTLTNSPDIYLFGALCEAEPYLEHDERVALWKSKLEEAINDENIARERAEFGAAPSIRLPVVFGDEP